VHFGELPPRSPVCRNSGFVTDRQLSLEWGEARASAIWKPNELGRTVLDLGCSWGYLLRFLAIRGRARRLIGVDTTPAWDGIHEWHWREVPELAFHHGDLESFSALGGSVDLILCSAMLNELTPEDVDATVSAAYRLLRPGGEMLVDVGLVTGHFISDVSRRFAMPVPHLAFGEYDLLRQLSDTDRVGHQYSNCLTATGYLMSFARAGFEILGAERKRNIPLPVFDELLASEFDASEAEISAGRLAVRLVRPFEVEDLAAVAPVGSTMSHVAPEAHMPQVPTAPLGGPELRSTGGCPNASAHARRKHSIACKRDQ
jgi:2-polyprenyl-3-methyl-5-hydroxy-6-metoxy-1,4-benzoquinol methylase